MAKESRTHNTFLNVKVNFIFYFITFIVFFSRKIFLEGLGDDFIGLTGTLIPGLLNLAELGIGAAIIFTLYKPLFEQNMEQINDVISVFGYLYRETGLFILFIAIAISRINVSIYYFYPRNERLFNPCLESCQKTVIYEKENILPTLVHECRWCRESLFRFVNRHTER